MKYAIPASMLLVLFMFSPACRKNKDSGSKPPGKKPLCFTVTDASTGTPLEGAQVSIATNVSAFATEYVTDASGKCCMEEPLLEGEYVTVIDVRKDGYLRFEHSGASNSIPPPVIGLQKAVYIAMQVRNVPPAAAQDGIWVYPCSEFGPWTFWGIVDSLVLVASHPACGKIYFQTGKEACSCNPWDSVAVHWQGRDTAFVTIAY